MDMDRSRGFGVPSGRIILLGDGTELIPDQGEEDLFDQSEEDQVSSAAAAATTTTTATSQVQPESSDNTRNDREGTPGPQTKDSSASISESPASTTTDNAEAATEKPAAS